MGLNLSANKKINILTNNIFIYKKNLHGLLKERDALPERKKCNCNKPSRPLLRHVKFEVTSTLASSKVFTKCNILFF